MAQPEKSSTQALSSDIANRLIEDFRDPDVREIYADEFINMKIATQIKVLREQREWTQEQLALLAEMKQERVAVLENVNYESWTLNVLRRFAKAFDLVVDVEFKEFGDLLNTFDQFGRESLQKRSFKDDPVFKRKTKDNVRPFPSDREPATGSQQILLQFDTEQVKHLKPRESEELEQIEKLIKKEAERIATPLKQMATAAGR